MFNNYRGFHLVEAHHNSRLAQWFHPNTVIKKSVQAVIVVILTLILWNIPADWFGIANLTIVQQRVIAIFAFATLMWVMEIVPSWATSVSIIVLMLLFTSDSGIAPMVQETSRKVAFLQVYHGNLRRPRYHVVYWWLYLGNRRNEDRT